LTKKEKERKEKEEEKKKLEMEQVSQCITFLYTFVSEGSSFLFA